MRPTLTAFNYATIDQNGIAPDSRVPTANDAYIIADQLRRDNATREHRWGTIYKCYKRFPPTDYSQIAKKQLFGLSNVPFGQMTFEVDEKKSAYIDMVIDRPTASKIITSIGNDKEKVEWSDLISLAWDRALWEWESYFSNVDQDLEQMLLFGKGIEIMDDKATWFSRCYKNNEVLIPDGTRSNLENLGEMVIREKYTPLELWKKIENTKDNPDSGWNFWAGVEAIRYHTQNRDYRMTNTQFLEKVASGNVNLSHYLNVFIYTYIVLIKEWNGSITKSVILQSYAPIAEARRFKSEKKYIDSTGYLYLKKDWARKWDDIIWAFHGAAGSGLWHEIKGHGEDIFPAARQYDITMNKVIDGVNLEMMTPIKGMSPDSTQKLKQMEWGRMFILPDGVDYAQRGFQLPIGDAINATNVIMQDTYRGMSSFNQVKPRAKQTLGEAELNFQQDAKLSGTELKRYNLCHTKWQRGLYRRFVKCKSGWEGNEIFQKFKRFLRSKGVPEEAWQWENLENLTSNMLAGAGSPATKVLASMKVAEIAGAIALTDGQENAYRDAIAGLAGRDNVDNYRPAKKKDISDQARVIAFENGVLNDPQANPENAIVEPTDNHVEHIRGHFSDAMGYLQRAMQAIQSGEYDAKEARNSVAVMLLKGGHIAAHMQMLASDPTKAPIVKQIAQSIEQLKTGTDQLISIAQEMAQSQQQPDATSPEERKLQLEIASKTIDLEAKQKTNELKLAATAQRHQQRMEIDKEKAATGIAIERAKAESAGKPKPKPKPNPSGSSTE